MENPFVLQSDSNSDDDEQPKAKVTLITEEIERDVDPSNEITLVEEQVQDDQPPIINITNVKDLLEAPKQHVENVDGSSSEGHKSNSTNKKKIQIDCGYTDSHKSSRSGESCTPQTVGNHLQ